MTLAGKCAIITGANRGLGFEIAKHFVAAEVNVMLCARDEKLLLEATTALQRLAGHKSKVISLKTDLTDLTQIENLVTTTLKTFRTIDILIANAGIHGSKGPLDEIDWHEWSQAIDINLKGHVFLTKCLLPHLKKNKSGKIIFLSGGGATQPFPYLSAYAASKAGLVRFAETLAAEVKEFNIDVNAVAPGALNTQLLDDILLAGPQKIGEEKYAQALAQKKNGGASLSLAAELCVFLASHACDGISGKLISAVWDPWKKLPDYLAELQQSDIYTLRRITPEDRKKDWSET